MNATKPKKYFPSQIESKWQEKWKKDGLYRFDLEKESEPYYTLVELPYPSGDLHLGHWFAFVPPDAHARYMRMTGRNVFFPNGFDAFGLPAENAAIKRGIHPRDWTLSNIQTMKEQFATMGTMIDWNHEAITCEPEYYRFNQWIFLKMFEKGLAYRGKALSNWCPSCQTVLANEAIENGTCWRCGTVVEQKEIEQWYLKITEYADRLLWDNTDQKISNGVNWPRSVREGQNNWIGRSEGALLSFPLEKPYHFVLLHGFGGSSEANFYPWLKKSLEEKGHSVFLPQLPHTDNPTEEEQVQFVLERGTFDENTIVFGHSLGSVVAMKVVEKLKTKIAGLVLSGTFAEPKFKDHKRPFANTFTWSFNSEKITSQAGFIRVIHDIHDSAVPEEQAQKVSEMLGVPLEKVEANADHFDAKEEPEILKRLLPSVDVFTTRPDTLYGATFLVVAPEHPIIEQILKQVQDDSIKSEVSSYIKLARQKTELERMEQKEKTGVFSGLYAIHPLTSEKLPIWVADYVLAGYGTGAIMAVPAHDERDFEFAQKFDLPVKKVIKPSESSEVKNQTDSDVNVYVGDGILTNSGKWDGWQVPKDIARVIASLEKAHVGKKKVTYHLRDWSVSRQRYWGTPVPIIYCTGCWEVKSEKVKVKSEYGRDFIEKEGTKYAIVPVKDESLPVELPYEVDYTPKGKPPLATAEDWLHTPCPVCGGKALRDPETLDTFFDSSWYYYRYTSPRYTSLPFDTEKVEKLMPVDVYFGGAEHTLGHTLYARFFTKFFKDINLVEFDEFALKRVQHGVILGPDGFRMSKSRGNVVNPDDVVKEYGADTVRLYLCFMMPYEDTVAPWNPKAIAGIYRFLMRIWQLQSSVVSHQLSDIGQSGTQEIGLPLGKAGEQKTGEQEPENRKQKTDYGDLSKEDLYQMHKTIKKVGDDIYSIKFNTAIASLMEWLNYLSAKEKVSREEYETLLLLLAPFAPHITEELYQSLGNSRPETQNPEFSSIHLQPWPEYKKEYLIQDQVEIAVQINGKLRATLEIDTAKLKDQNEVEARAKDRENVKRYLDGKNVKKVIYVPGKILNFVIG